MKTHVVLLLVVLFPLSSLWQGCARSGPPCEPLIKRIKEEGTYERIVGWVDEHITKEKLASGALQLENGTAKDPLTYRVKSDFDWSILGMNPPSSAVYIERDANGEWGAVWLGSLRRAVIVDLKPGWTGKSDEFVYRDRRVIVYCAKD